MSTTAIWVDLRWAGRYKDRSRPFDRKEVGWRMGSSLPDPLRDSSLRGYRRQSAEFRTRSSRHPDSRNPIVDQGLRGTVQRVATAPPPAATPQLDGRKEPDESAIRRPERRPRILGSHQLRGCSRFMSRTRSRRRTPANRRRACRPARSRPDGSPAAASLGVNENRRSGSGDRLRRSPKCTNDTYADTQ